MPRIIPRLLRIISQQSELHKTYPFDIRAHRTRPKSLHRPCPPIPSLRPASYSRSILLDSTVITRSRDYVRRKSLPPRIYVPKGAKARKNEYDRPRQMNEDERRWWANPYLRMLASPMRPCIVTSRYLPSDFLIRLAPVKFVDRRSAKVVIVPDGLQHTKFTARRVGRAVHILCSREALSCIKNHRGHTMHPNLMNYVAHLLRLRVLQELELLVEQLEYSHWTFKMSDGLQPILRRLTRYEWKQLKETGIMPPGDAVAVLVVPPLNKNLVTGQRPESSMSASLLTSSMKPRNPLPPLSSMLNASDFLVNRKFPDLIPAYQIPLYNGLALFPNEYQRAALHSLLLRILTVERRLYQSTIQAKGHNIEKEGARSDEKHSHAFLLSSNSDLIRRGDVSAVAIALWRIRMFEESLEDDSIWTTVLE